jgi:integrase
MVRVQLLAGCRPGEVVQMRTADLTMAGDVWTYRPAQHKGRWRGKPRVIYLGPRAQAVLAPFLRPAAPLAYLFSPAAAMAEFRDRQKAARRTPQTPAQVWTPVADPKRRPGESYSGKSYAKAVEKACKKAGVPAWCPLQLRHTAGTDARRIAGLDGAQVTLGHAKADVTQVYAERDAALAVRVALERG